MGYAQIQSFELLITAGLDKQLAFWMMNQGKWERKFNAMLPKSPTCMDIDLISNFVLIGLECDIGIYMLDKLQKETLRFNSSNCSSRVQSLASKLEIELKIQKTF